MTEAPLLRADADGISLLTLNRPARRNALDYATIDGLLAALDDIEAARDIGAAILTGAGDVAFSAGADIFTLSESVAQGGETALREFVGRGQRLTARIEEFPKPIIVAVNGLAYGGGCEVTEAAALAIASERARFAKPEIDLGFAPPFGGTQRLPRLVGRKRALAMILTGQPIGADEAAAIGLVNRVVPHDRLLPEARALALRIAGKPPLAVRACLASVTSGLNMSMHEGLQLEAMQFHRLAASADLLEGVAAFTQKRRAAFRGA
jgi:enoyl-CoA hydratase/carnithine racemase